MWFTFDGLDGVGKSSLLGEVALVLRARGVRVETLSTPLLQHARLRRVIESQDRIDLLIGFYIGAATATASGARTIIESKRADIVLVDRYIYSTLALAHGLAASLSPEVESEFQTESLRPSAGFLITCDPVVRAARLEERGDTRELEQQSHREVIGRVSDRYLKFGLHRVENTDGRLRDTSEGVAAIIGELWRPSL